MRKIILLVFVIPAISLAQSVSSTVTTSATEEITNYVKTTITTKTTNNYLPPFETTVENTIATEAASGATNAAPAPKGASSTVWTFTSNPVPLQAGEDEFFNAHIYLIKSEVANNQYQFTYYDYDDNNLLKAYITPTVADGVITHTDHTFVGSPKNPISLITVPFKIRPNIQDRGQVSKGGIANIGLYYPLIRGTADRLFADGGKSKHTLSLGVFGAPMVQDYDLTNTNGKVDSSRDNLAVSTGVGIVYTYNSLSFVIVPAAVDYGLTSKGHDWVYNGRYYWGFGIGITITELIKILK